MATRGATRVMGIISASLSSTGKVAANSWGWSSRTLKKWLLRLDSNQQPSG